MVKAQIQDKIRGSLIAGAIGDALGYQIEFDRGIESRQVSGYLDNQGFISDDTQMTLVTANAIYFRQKRLEERGIALPITSACALGYIDWYEKQCNIQVTDETQINQRRPFWVCELPALAVRRTPGTTCLTELCRLQSVNNFDFEDNAYYLQNPVNNSKGCGSVMRIAPFGLAINNLEWAGNLAAFAGAITHGHPLSHISCYFVATLIGKLTYTDYSIDEAVVQSLLNLQNNFKYVDDSYISEFVELIQKAKKLAAQNTDDAETIRQLGGGWVAEEAAAIAVYSCLKYPDDIIEAIICAVNHDGDSDSTGAIAGNIIGAKLGYEGKIREYYIENLEIHDEILKMADQLAEIAVY